jgi:hypothetical protein
VGQTRSQVDAALQALYDRVPAIPDCDGRCWISCGPTDRSQREDQRIREAGYRITPVDEALRRADTYWCEALTGDKRCAVYEMRPMVCRLWGAVEGMPCPYGCVPEGGWLSDQEGNELLAESMRIGGSRFSYVPPGELRAAVASKFMRQKSASVREQGRAGIALRARWNVPAAFRPPERRGVPCPGCGVSLTMPAGLAVGACGHCGQVVKPGEVP